MLRCVNAMQVCDSLQGLTSKMQAAQQLEVPMLLKVEHP